MPNLMKSCCEDNTGHIILPNQPESRIGIYVTFLQLQLRVGGVLQGGGVMSNSLLDCCNPIPLLFPMT